MAELSETVPASLYVHIPWCVRKCPYCDFNSHALKSDLPEAAYLDALVADLETECAARELGAVDSVFIGGGTPSLFSAAGIARLIEAIDARVHLTSECEITLEANPGTAEADRFEGFRRAGVNRLSIGVQSFDDGLLEAIGRIHDAGEARAAVQMAKTAGFESLNIDLMYALPGQTLDQALFDVDTAIALEPTHISFYQLTLEPNTLFYRQPPQLPADDVAWEMSQRGIERLRAAGYHRYEISAFAHAGFECRHNLNYWRFGDYAGIGAGAHGKHTDRARSEVRRSLKHRHPRAYLKAAEHGRFDLKREVIASQTLALEFMMNALRLVDGFELMLFSQRTGLPMDEIHHAVTAAEDRGLIAIGNGVLKPTPVGLQFLNELLLYFAPDIEPRLPPLPCASSGDGLSF